MSFIMLFLSGFVTGLGVMFVGYDIHVNKIFNRNMEEFNKILKDYGDRYDDLEGKFPELKDKNKSNRT